MKNSPRGSISRLTRRSLLAGFGGALLAPPPFAVAAAPRPALALQAKPGAASLRSGGADTPIWSLPAATPDAIRRFRRGDEIDLTLQNDLPIPVCLNWHGLDGLSAAEPLVGRPPVPPGARDTLTLAPRHAGTLLCDLRLTGDGLARPLPARVVVVQEREPVAVDRDEVFLIEDWRLRADGSAVAPGTDPGDAAIVYTVNGRGSSDITLRGNERLRLRLINGCQRNVIALKIEDHDVIVMAIDGQPAEPFPARGGQIVLAPGSRIDTFIDAARPAGSAASIILHDGKAAHPIGRLITSNEAPLRNAPLPAPPALPDNGLPAKLELRNAARFEVMLSGSDWIAPALSIQTAPPAFRIKAGRIVVLALTNRAAIPSVFHLHGHHYRLLDRLDDGWKPFWLDTLVIDSGQTQRVAFAAEYKGAWLMEAMACDWATPRLVRRYIVE